MDYKLVLDIIVAILLAATIGYAVLLNNRLGQLRKNRDEMVKLVASFNDATARAEAGIPKLKRATEEAAASMQERVAKAQSLRDDLAFMIERADAMANRLESAVRSARTDAKPVSQAPAAQPAAAAPAKPTPPRPSPNPPTALGVEDDERSEVERELLRALQSAR